MEHKEIREGGKGEAPKLHWYDDKWPEAAHAFGDHHYKIAHQLNEEVQKAKDHAKHAREQIIKEIEENY